MDTALKIDKTEHLVAVWRGGAVRELKEEYVVPDSMPDVSELLDAQGILTVQGKDTNDGYVELRTTAALSFLYAAEDGSLRGLELSLPAELRVDAPGVDLDCHTVADVRLRTVETRIVNSRKLAIRAELEADAACYRSATLALASGLVEGEGVQLLRAQADAFLVSDVREKTFALTDDYPFPSGCGVDAHILSRRAEVLTEDVQFVGGKVLFRGRIRSELLFSEREGGQCFFGRYETEFSQLMEMTASGEDVLPEMTLFLTGAYYDLPEYGQEGERVRAEFHVAAQCVCRERRTLPYLSDLYSNRTELLPTREEQRFAESVRAVSSRQTVADRVEGVPAEGELLCGTASVGSVVSEPDCVRTSVGIRLLYRLPDGSACAVRGRLPAEFTLDLSQGESLRDVRIGVADLYCVPGTGDVRISLRMEAMAERETVIRPVCAVAEDEDAWRSREKSPSAVLIWTEPGVDLWSLARRYHSTVDDILAVNGERRHGLLLIPKGR